MRNSLLPVLTVVLATVVLSAQSFDLRLGQWEYTMNMKMPPEALAKLPPAARAVMSQPQTNRSCLTAEDLKAMNLGVSDDEDCKVTSKKITGNVADVTMACTGDRPRTQTMHAEAVSRESIRATMKMVGGVGPSEIAITGKWLTAACKE